MVNKMASVKEKNSKFNENYGFEYSSFSKMFVNSKIVKKIRRYFTRTHAFENDDENPMIFNYHVNISTQETITKDIVRMNIR
ncbi:MAG: hypothetical protein HeimC3_05080 [Candidatus Heimdallarchaeota archaeon LC_3]|nr:MAG: hypothetical protein HeimC3_05080 [Candidatus Heimdallarchaeota archaeon LC_3]